MQSTFSNRSLFVRLRLPAAATAMAITAFAAVPSDLRIES